MGCWLWMNSNKNQMMLKPLKVLNPKKTRKSLTVLNPEKSRKSLKVLNPKKTLKMLTVLNLEKSRKSLKVLNSKVQKDADPYINCFQNIAFKILIMYKQDK